MTQIQFDASSFPGANLRLQQGLAMLLLKMAAMGVLSAERITALDKGVMRRAVDDLQTRRLAPLAAIEFAPLLAADPGDLDAEDALRMTGAVEHLAEVLGESPSPLSEWGSMRAMLGDEGLSRLVGISESSLRRYASLARPTPQDVAERLHWLAMVVADLSGAYNDFGIRRWFERVRPQLGGASPRLALGDAWRVDDAAANQVRALAASLSGGQALAA